MVLLLRTLVLLYHSRSTNNVMNNVLVLVPLVLLRRQTAVLSDIYIRVTVSLLTVTCCVTVLT
jgi:hypothetical protein